MADDSIRQTIIATVFSKLNAQGHQETYVSHVKIWEDVTPEEGGKKPRYILLSRMYDQPAVSPLSFTLTPPPGSSDGSGLIHKSKRNTNGSFSVGKTWKLRDLRAVEVSNVRPIWSCVRSG